MAALMAPSPESFIETRQRVLGTRNGTVKNRHPQIPLNSGDCSSQLLHSTPAAHLSPFKVEDTDESDDELFFAHYTQTKSRHCPGQGYSTAPLQHPAPSSRPLEPPVTPGAHGLARLSASEPRPHGSSQHLSHSSELPLAPHTDIRPEDSFSFSHCRSTSLPMSPRDDSPRFAPGFLFPSSCTVATGASEEESLENHRRRVLGAKQGSINEKNLGRKLATFQPLEGCQENKVLFEEDDIDDEWESPEGSGFHQRQAPSMRTGLRPATALAAGKSVAFCEPMEGSYLRARTFQGRDEEPKVVAYQRSQTTSLWGERGTPQRPTLGTPSPSGLPTSLSVTGRSSPARRFDSPMARHALPGAKATPEGERDDSPNLMRRVVDHQPFVPRSSSSTNLSRLSGPRQARSSVAGGGPSGAEGFSPEYKTRVQKSATQRPLAEARRSEAELSLPRSSTVDTRARRGMHPDSRLRSGSPKSVSARYSSTAARVIEELSPARSMSPGGLYPRQSLHGLPGIQAQERVSSSGSPLQSRTNYSRQMAQAAAAARGERHDWCG